MCWFSYNAKVMIVHHNVFDNAPALVMQDRRKCRAIAPPVLLHTECLLLNHHASPLELRNERSLRCISQKKGPHLVQVI